MTRIYFADLPKSIFLEYSGRMPTGHRGAFQLREGRVTLFVWNQQATVNLRINGGTIIDVQRLGGRWIAIFVGRRRTGLSEISIDTLQGLKLGDQLQGPNATLGDQIFLSKKTIDDPTKIRVGSLRVDTSKPKQRRPQRPNTGAFSWRYTRTHDYELVPNVRFGQRGFFFVEGKSQGELLLDLGQLRSPGAGGNPQPIHLSAGGFSLNFRSNIQVFFNLDSSQPLIFAWGGGTLAELSYAKGGLTWCKDPSDMLSHASLRRVSIGPKWISASEFEGSELGIQIGRGENSSYVRKHTYVFGPPDRFRWHCQWPAPAGDVVDPEAPEVHLVYHDPNYHAHHPSAPDYKREQYYGIWVGNLADQIGAPARFDVSWVTLCKPVESAKYSLNAGGQLSLPPCEDRHSGADSVESMVWPKYSLTYSSETSFDRSISIPLERTAFLRLAVDANRKHSSLNLTISFNATDGTPSGSATLFQPSLLTSPLDVASKVSGGFDHWRLEPPTDIPSCTLKYGAWGIEVTPNLFDGWNPTGATRFDVANGGNQKLEVSIDKINSNVDVSDAGTLTYTQVSAGLLYEPEGAPDAYLVSEHQEINVADLKVIEHAGSAWLIRNEGVGDVVFALQERYASEEQFRVKAKSYIWEAAGGSDWDTVSLKMNASLRIALVSLEEISTGETSQKFWYELANRHKDAEPGIAVDLSGSNSGEPWSILGWTESAWEGFKSTDRAAWPAYKEHLVRALDPSAPNWRGHIFRDMPVALPSIVVSKAENYPALRAFCQAIRKSVLMDYGWHDERGWTWRISQRVPYVAVFNSGFIEIALSDLKVSSAANKLVRAEGALAIDLPFLTDDDVVRTLARKNVRLTMSDQGDGLQFDEAGIDAGENYLWEGALKDPAVGVEKLGISSVGTDLKNLLLRGDLFLTSGAQESLGLNDKLKVELSLALNNDGDSYLEGRLPSEQTGRVSGWPITVRGLRLSIGPGAGALVLVGAINLGVDGFQSVEFEATFTKGGRLILSIQGFQGHLSVGDFSLGLDVRLGSEEKGYTGDNDDAFYGFGYLKSDLTGEIEVELKIGQQDGDSYWVAAATSGTAGQFKFGRDGQLDNYSLLLGRRIKHKTRDRVLKTALAEPSGQHVLKATDPKGAGINQWLEEWEYDADTDFVIGASGGLSLDEVVFKAPSDTKKNRTGIMLSSGGYFRIEGYSELFGLGVPVAYNLSLDTQKKTIFAEFQAPSFNPPGSDITVSGGYIGLGIRYAGHKPYFALGLGWPFQSYLNPDVTAPDWSRAITVRWDGAFPLNTFAGGMMVHIDADQDGFGIAIRGGWTKSYEAKAWRLVAQAELGVMVGGVIHFGFKDEETEFVPGSLSYRLRMGPSLLVALADTTSPDMTWARPCIGSIEDALQSIVAQDVYIRSANYIDIWGAARVRAFGVTLASVGISAHAQVSYKFFQKIYWAGANARFSVSVRVGCTTYHQSAAFPVVFIEEAKPAGAQLMLPDRAKASLVPAPSSLSNHPEADCV